MTSDHPEGVKTAFAPVWFMHAKRTMLVAWHAEENAGLGAVLAVRLDWPACCLTHALTVRVYCMMRVTWMMMPVEPVPLERVTVTVHGLLLVPRSVQSSRRK